ncbi:MAG: DNA polymerase III subunit delta [Acidobacteriia bacterium]|nr:DNA polymerase III subunit delta [Terriglobia bacterium]
MPTLTSDELDFDLDRGRFCPVYFFLGKEEYLLRTAISTLKAKAIAPEALAFNFVECSGRSTEGAKIVEEANTFPMMSPRRLVLVTDVDEMPAAGLEALAAYAGGPHEKTVLVLTAADFDRRTSFYKRMADCACVVEFAKLKEAALERWAGNFVSRRGYRIAPAALRRLVDLAGSDLLTLINEIEKLILYAGKEKEIQESAVDTLVPASREHGIFELTAALGRRDRKAALRLLGNLLEAGEAPLVIVSMMARHFRQILIAKELLAEGCGPREISRAAQVPEFILSDFLRQAKALEPEMARNMYQRLAHIDRSFKSSRPDERLLLEQLVCSL